MQQSPELTQFAHDFHQEVVSNASLEGQETMLSEAFTSLTLESLSEIGEWPEVNLCYHRQRGMEVNGWGWDDESGTLDLCVVIFEGGGTPTIQKREAEASLKRLEGFLAAATKGIHNDLEESSTQFDLAYLISRQRRKIEHTRLFLVTDGLLTMEPPEAQTVADIKCTYHLWDIGRLQRVLSSGTSRDTIEIDLVERYGSSLGCLPAPSSGSEFDSYLMVIPGEILSDLYNEFGARLLELNVRSFLQARGKVNKKIRETILTEPERFFAYNNGISATASHIDIEEVGNGTAQVHRIVDLQIVNGGQTTASIATAALKDKADLSRLSVQAKLTIVPEERLGELVPLISRYANSQNRVTEADLSSNHEFHVVMEELSRSIWAPAADGGTRETRWFYERARGQYQDAVNREQTPARKRKFKEVHPTRQKFTKTDLAKFENTWAQYPYIVSKGAQKNFVDFMLRVNKTSSRSPDQAYFERVCALGLMFREAERIVRKLDQGGYRANVVTYTLALIANRTAGRVDLGRIWREQKIGPGLTEAIEEVAQHVHAHIADPPGGQNVTEWCKKKKCWDELLERDVEIPESLFGELGGRDATRSTSTTVVGPEVGLSEEEIAEIAWARGIPDETWFGISAWAKDTNQLQPWQRSISFSLGRLAKQGGDPSIKQARQGRILYDEAMRLGFK